MQPRLELLAIALHRGGSGGIVGILDVDVQRVLSLPQLRVQLARAFVFVVRLNEDDVGAAGS